MATQIVFSIEYLGFHVMQLSGTSLDEHNDLLERQIISKCIVERLETNTWCNVYSNLPTP